MCLCCFCDYLFARTIFHPCGPLTYTFRSASEFLRCILSGLVFCAAFRLSVRHFLSFHAAFCLSVRVILSAWIVSQVLLCSTSRLTMVPEFQFCVSFPRIPVPALSVR